MKVFLAAVSAGGLLGACAAPDLGPRPQLQAADSLASAKSFSRTQTVDWPSDQWWRAMGDPQLTGLIEEAIAHAPTLAMAQARMRRAEALQGEAGAALLPSATASAQANEVKQSYNNGIPPAFVPKGYNDTGRVQLGLSYELDFFGRNRAALKAATSAAAATKVEVEAARLALATSVGAAYAELARLYAARDIAEAEVRLRTDTAALVNKRVENGLDTRGELRQAEAGVPAARQQLAAMNESISLTRNSIAALVGAGPDRGLEIRRPTLSITNETGLPDRLALNLIGRRPDIVAARFQAEAAASRIDIAHASFYPNVNLLGFIGFQALGLGNLFNSGSDIGQAGPAISLPIFQGGQLRAGYRKARAEYDEAVAQYDDTLVRALKEVADSAASQQSLDMQLKESRAAVAASQEAYDIARKRYDGGLSNFISVLSAEDALLANRRTLANLEARAFTLKIQLIRALGGGFTSADTLSTEPTHG